MKDGKEKTGSTKVSPMGIQGVFGDAHGSRNNAVLQQAVSLMHPHVAQEIQDLAAWLARQALSPAEFDTLAALVTNGPVWDGDLPSKAGRDTLIALGLAVKCVHRGRQGFQAATDLGWRVYNATLDIMGAVFGGEVAGSIVGTAEPAA